MVKLNDPLSKYAPPGGVPDWQENQSPVNLATHTSALPREQRRRRSSSGVCLAHPPAALELALYRDLKTAPGSQAAYSIWPSIYWRTRSPPPPANRIRSCLKNRSPGRWG